MFRLIFPIVLLLLSASHPSLASSLAAGEPLTEAIARELLGEALQARQGGSRFRVRIERPHLPPAFQPPWRLPRPVWRLQD